LPLYYVRVINTSAWLDFIVCAIITVMGHGSGHGSDGSVGHGSLP